MACGWCDDLRAGPEKRRPGSKAILSDTRALLGPASTRESYFGPIDRQALELLHTRARAAQTEFKEQPSGTVRVIQCWPLLLVEQGLAIYLWHAESPAEGCKLAADWAQSYDSRYGNGLNGPSRGKLNELVRFMFTVEVLEDEQ